MRQISIWRIWLRLRYIVVGNEFRSYLRVLEQGRMHILTPVENEHVNQDSTAVLQG